MTGAAMPASMGTIDAGHALSAAAGLAGQGCGLCSDNEDGE